MLIVCLVELAVKLFSFFAQLDIEHTYMYIFEIIIGKNIKVNPFTHAKSMQTKGERDRERIEI